MSLTHHSPLSQVHLSNQEKLVYSPHVYGPSVYQQHYFDDQRFPANMPEVRGAHRWPLLSLSPDSDPHQVWAAYFAFAQQLTLMASLIRCGRRTLRSRSSSPTDQSFSGRSGGDTPIRIVSGKTGRSRTSSSAALASSTSHSTQIAMILADWCVPLMTADSQMTSNGLIASDDR